MRSRSSELVHIKYLASDYYSVGAAGRRPVGNEPSVDEADIQAMVRDRPFSTFAGEFGNLNQEEIGIYSLSMGWILSRRMVVALMHAESLRRARFELGK